jgi:hypothetical protein
VDEVRQLLLSHLDDHYRFYGAEVGVRTARNTSSGTRAL